MAISEQGDPAYVALLGLAESFRQVNNINECVRCLKAILNLSPGPLIVARTHLQLGSLIMDKTVAEDQARQHLEQAWYVSQPLDGIYEVKFEAASLLSKSYLQAGNTSGALTILNSATELSSGVEYWHCRLILQLASVHTGLQDYTAAHAALQTGADYAFMQRAYYTRTLFVLSKSLLFLCERRFQEANPLLQQVSPDIENWVANYQGQIGLAMASQQKEYLQMFYLVLQVCYYLMVGQVKSVKGVLKQLQQSIQTITAPDWPADTEVTLCQGREVDQFIWMSREHLCVLVYLVTVMHSMQAGFMEKAERYTDKAIVQIGKLKAQQDNPILSSFHVMLVEHMIQCRLVMGNKTKAITELGQLARLLTASPVLLTGHRAQLHTLLGLYSMSMNCMDEAETQLNAALRTSKERELWTFANLNLAIVYLRQRRTQDFVGLLDRISPDQLPSSSHSMKAAAYYIHGLQAFFAAQYGESKRYLRETLKMANAEDLNRLTSCSLVLLGHIFLSLGNGKESMNMVTPAMQLAGKIPDVHVQLWASSILKDLYRLQGDQARQTEGEALHNNFSQTLLKDHLSATQRPDHRLITWTDGAFPV
jgi:MAternally-affected-uncoordination protein